MINPKTLPLPDRKFQAALTVRDRFHTLPAWLVLAQATTGELIAVESGLTFQDAIRRRADLRPQCAAIFVGFEFSSEKKESFCLCPPTPPPADQTSLTAAVLEYERTLILRALEHAEGSVTRAAKLLGIAYQTLGYTINSRHRDLLVARSPVIKKSKRVPA